MKTSTILARVAASMKGGTVLSPKAQAVITKLPPQQAQHKIIIQKSKARMKRTYQDWD